MKLLLTVLLLLVLPWSAKAQVRLLSGPVDFFWQNATEPRIAHVPHTWDHEFGLPAFGWARYEMSLDLPPGEELMLRLGPVSSSFRLLINGVERAHCGTVGVDRLSSEAGYCPRVRVPLEKGPAKIKLTLDVANFTSYAGGWISPLELATPKAFAAMEKQELGQGMLVLAVLLIMGFFHLLVYARRRSALSCRAFGFFCLSFLVFLSVADPSYPAARITDLSYASMLRLFNISLNLSLPLFMMYVQQLFPRYWFRGMIAFTWAYVIAWITIILVYRPDEFIPVAPAMRNFSLLSLFCTLLVMVQAYRDRLKGSGIFVLSIFFLAGAAALDMLQAQEAPMLNFGFLGFTFCQALLLARRPPQLPEGTIKVDAS